MLNVHRNHKAYKGWVTIISVQLSYILLTLYVLFHDNTVMVDRVLKSIDLKLFLYHYQFLSLLL